MKIAFIVHDYHRHGGHSRYVAELAIRFRKEHEVHVFANHWEEPDPDGISFHKVPAWTWRELSKVLTFILPATLMTPKGFDIVHSQGLCGLRHDIATVHFIQPIWLNELKKRGKITRISYLFWKWLVSPLEKYALGPKCSRRLIAISKGMISDLRNEYGIEGNVDLIYHGVDLDRFNPSCNKIHRDKIRQSWGVTSTDFVALFVGNLQKGASAAIRAVARVPGARLALVSGSDNFAEKKIALECGVSDRIIWSAKSREIEKYFAAADCFVFPTVYEPFGMVISEAMASGLPVITSRKAGAADLIQDGVSGWLMDEPWDVEAISDKLQRLKNDSVLCFEMGMKARQAIECFTWDRCASETLDVYREVVLEKKQVNSLG
jgi:UDP-glucose:(heptosyl)LPS alpha-1,3-glucosyltransferase